MMKTDKDDKLLKLAADRWRISQDEDKEERALYDKDVRFGINDEGCQWDKNIRDIRENDTPPRPCLVINKIPEKIDMVEGEFKQLKPSFKMRAVDSKADPIIAEVMAGLVRHIEYNSDGRSAYNTAHTSVLYGGRGGWRHDIVDNLDDPFVKKIEVNPIPNILSVYFDPKCKKNDKSDARFVFVTDLLPKKEFEAEYPSKDLESWPTESCWEGWRQEETYRIAEYWWKEKVEKTFYRVEREVNGIPTKITVTELDEGETAIKELKTKVDQVKWCKMTAGQILEGPYDWPTPHFPIFFESGKQLNIAGKTKTRGMVRFVIDAMSMYNYFASTSTETTALSPKSPYMLTADMIGPYGTMWDNANIKNTPYLLYNPDPSAPGAKPFREPPPQLSTAIANELQRLEHDIMATMGIYREGLGESDRARSGVAIQSLQRQGNIGTYAFTENFNTTYTYSIKAMIALIPHVYDTERIERIIGEDGEEHSIPLNARPGVAEPVIQELKPEVQQKYISGPREDIATHYNDLSVGTYDVRVSIGPSYTTQREELVATLMDLLKILPPQFAIALSPILAESLDMPDSAKIVGAFNRAAGIGEDGNPLPQAPPPEVIIEQMRMELEVMKQRDEMEIKRQEQGRKDLDTQINSMKTLMETEMMERGQQLQELISSMDAVRGHLEMVHGQAIERQKLAQTPGPGDQATQTPGQG